LDININFYSFYITWNTWFIFIFSPYWNIIFHRLCKYWWINFCV